MTPFPNGKTNGHPLEVPVFDSWHAIEIENLASVGQLASWAGFCTTKMMARLSAAEKVSL